MEVIKNAVIVLGIILFFSCYENKEVHISRTIIFEGKLYQIDKEKPFSGIVYNSYPNGKREYEGQYKNGLPNGRLIYWFEDGTIKKKGSLKDGMPIGRWVTYNKDKTENIIDY